jgi:IclR family transcriptional regulator, acetate operon repressor
MEAAERVAEVLALVLERSPRARDELDADAVAILERHGLVALTSGEVRPGPRLLRFARSGHDRRDLVALAEPPMRRLADESGETVNLMVAAARGAEALSQVDGRHVLGVSSWIGREVPDHCSAAGKLFLAFGTSRLPAGPLERRTPATIVDRDRLESELQTARTQGFATIVDELETGLAAVAAPIRDADGAVVAALSVAGPTVRLTEHRLALLGRVAIEQAHAVSTQLGYDGDLEDLLDPLRIRG